MAMQLAGALALAAITSYAAFRLRSLTRGGAIAATALGTVVFGLGGWQWALLLLAFFIPSSALTKLFGRTKRSVEEKFAKSGARDQMQVASNGGLAGLFVLLHALWPQAVWPWIGYAGALAAVNADTWATELGVLNPTPPRLITAISRTVEKGTSGGVSFAGTAASLAAALVVAAPAAWLSAAPFGTALVAIAIAGLAGSLMDSLLGATLQAVYFCPKDQKETEKHPLHSCGTPTVQIRGLSWLNNDLVNVACSITGASMALLVALALRAL